MLSVVCLVCCDSFKYRDYIHLQIETNDTVMRCLSCALVLQFDEYVAFCNDKLAYHCSQLVCKMLIKQATASKAPSIHMMLFRAKVV
jgi:hypothetical protein